MTEANIEERRAPDRCEVADLLAHYFVPCEASVADRDRDFRQKAMSDIDAKHREQIEAWLNRRLSDVELEPAASLEALTDAQLAVVAEIQPRNLVTPMLFLRAVAPDADRRAMQRLVDDIEGVVAARKPPRDWPNLPLFERHLGRPLVPSEKATAVTLATLSPTHLAVATELAHKELPVAFLYLHRVVPNESIDACQALAKQLAG